MAESATRLPVKTDKPSAPASERDFMPFESLRREIDRLFDDFRPFGWRLGGRRPNLDADMPFARRAFAINPAFDLAERDKEYEITAELPGIDEKNVEIRLSNHMLTVRGEKSDAKEEKDKDYYLSERRFGSFQRSFQIPEGVDPEHIEAVFAKGFLTIHLPKTAEARQSEKKIPVKAA
jgi:HSP20 family protein